MSDTPAKRPALSPRERVYVDAMLAVYCTAFVSAKWFYPYAWLFPVQTWRYWFSSVGIAWRRGVPLNADLFFSGFLGGVLFAFFFLFLGFLAIRLRVPWIPRLHALWWWTMFHAVALLGMLLHVFYETAAWVAVAQFVSTFLPVAIIAITQLSIAITGLRATRARERAEAA